MRSKRCNCIPAGRPRACFGLAEPWSRACAAFFLLSLVVLGCGREESGTLTTGKTVHQEKSPALRGLGDYRSVEMPERARQNLAEADPGAAGAAAYWGSVFNR